MPRTRQTAGHNMSLQDNMLQSAIKRKTILKPHGYRMHLQGTTPEMTKAQCINECENVMVEVACLDER